MPRVTRSSHAGPGPGSATQASTGTTDAPTASKKRVRSKRRKAKAESVPIDTPTLELEHGALVAFFERFRKDGFIYEPDALPPLEFQRLCHHFGFFRRDPRSRPLYEEYGKAMNAEFGIKFGKNMNDLGAWQTLCKRIGIDPIPTTLKKARDEFKATHVNIVELMWTRIPDGEMEKFDTEEKLAAYTRNKPGRTFPREFVEKKGILWYLLRRIWNEKPKEYVV